MITILPALAVFGHHWDIGVRTLWPQLLCPPASVVSRGVGVPCVSEPSCFLGVAKVGLFDHIGYDDYEAEVLPRNLVMQVVCLRAELKTLLIERRGYRLTRRRVFERA